MTGLWLHELGSTDSNPGSDTDNKVIASSHKGPLLAYMKKVSDATQNPSAGPGNGWFKISEVGLISSTQWAVDALISAGGVQSVKIPSCIENGDYLLRFELIALHSASSYPGAQFYVRIFILPTVLELANSTIIRSNVPKLQSQVVLAPQAHRPFQSLVLTR